VAVAAAVALPSLRRRRSLSIRAAAPTQAAVVAAVVAAVAPPTQAAAVAAVAPPTQAAAVAAVAPPTRAVAAQRHHLPRSSRCYASASQSLRAVAAVASASSVGARGCVTLNQFKV
jgi:hypothetical protein